MAWTISYSARARRQLDKLDRQWRKQIVDYLSLEIANQQDPRRRGHGLAGDLSGIWRFRLGDYRICARSGQTNSSSWLSKSAIAAVSIAELLDRLALHQ